MVGLMRVEDHRWRRIESRKRQRLELEEMEESWHSMDQTRNQKLSIVDREVEHKITHMDLREAHRGDEECEEDVFGCMRVIEGGEIGEH